MSAHVLVGVSPAAAARRDELVRLAADLGAELAFLQLAAPSLDTVMDRLADRGAERIILVGVADSAAAPGVSWLRRIAAHWWENCGPGAPDVATAPAFLTEPGDRGAWHALVTSARSIADGGAGLTSSAWDEVPRHERQVLVCRGPRCTVARAEDTWRALVIAMMNEGLGDDDVLVTHTGCQFPCNHAPVITVQPDDVWYGRVDAQGAREIVENHLVEGMPVDSLRLARERASDRSAPAAGRGLDERHDAD